jgi:hypothetical protein
MRARDKEMDKELTIAFPTASSQHSVTDSSDKTCLLQHSILYDAQNHIWHLNSGRHMHVGLMSACDQIAAILPLVSISAETRMHTQSLLPRAA